jgi:hypothetical protein
MAGMNTDDIIRLTSLLVILLVGIAVPVALMQVANAATLEGSRDDFGLIRLASVPLESASQLGIVAPVIAITLLGAAIIFGFQLTPVFSVLIAGAILLLGTALYPIMFSALGAELLP